MRVKAMCENLNCVQIVNANRRYGLEKLTDEAAELRDKLYEICHVTDMFEQNELYKKVDRIYYKAYRRVDRRLNKLMNENESLM